MLTTKYTFLKYLHSRNKYIFAETAMGTSLHDMSEQQQEYREAVHQMSKIISYR